MYACANGIATEVERLYDEVIQIVRLLQNVYLKESPKIAWYRFFEPLILFIRKTKVGPRTEEILAWIEHK